MTPHENEPPGERQAGLAPHDGDAASAEVALPCRALTTLSPAEAGSERPSFYRQAPFLAQLIAAKHRLPQTRERRRAAPAEAIAAYRATAKLKA